MKGVELDPLVMANDPNKPLISKLLAVPSLRTRYLGYIRDIAEKWLDWKKLGPKLRGKLHIASGEADQYFLNNAVHLLDAFLSKASPRFEGKIVYGPGKPHGWTDLSPSPY